MDRRALELLAPTDSNSERIWRDLEAVAQPSYFLSWGWVSNWLAALPSEERPALAVMHDGREVSGAFFLAQRRVRRNLVLQNNALYFNATGSSRHDDLGIAHNGMLAAPGARRSLAHVLDGLPAAWDELHLPAIDRNAFDDLDASSELADRYKVRLEREQLAPFVDLAAVRSTGYEALLAPRVQARLDHPRGWFGDLDIEVATTPLHALDIYGEMLRLHARNAAARHQRGAFADAWVESFHRRLILDRLAHGEIQLMRISSEGRTVGCLYNYVYGGRVIAHESGLAHFDERDFDLASFTQAASIEYNAAAGHTTYEVRDAALSTGANRMVWLSVQRPLAWVSIEDTARRWYSSLVGERQLALA